LDGMECIRMFVTADFGLVVVSDGIDDQSVAFPAAYRIAKPRRIGIRLMRFAVQRNDAERSGILVHQNQRVLVLNNLELIRHTERVRWTERHAVCRSSSIQRPAVDFIFFGARFQLWSAAGAARSTSAAATKCIDTGKVRFAISSAWKGFFRRRLIG